MKTHRTSVPRGFSLLEALVALLIVTFGLLALAGVNLKLSRSEDVSKQRSEAVRLAQEKIEDLRSFTQIAVAAGTGLAWDSLAGGTDPIANSSAYTTNTSFTRTWQLRGTTDDPMRNVQVSVSWTDRNNEAQTVSFASVISKTDPSDVGSLGFPLPANTVLKQPKNRNINIPVPAIDLGNGQSAVQLVSTFAAVFSNETGYVVKTCNRIVTTASDLSVGCTDTTAYILAGYISMHGSGSPGFPTGLVPNTEQITGATGVTCSVNDAVDQNNNATISGYKYYLCVVTVASAASGWSGTLRMAGAGLSAGTNYLVCRFQYPTESGVTANQRNVQGYESVAESLDSQNYLITTSSSCPIVNSLATVQHQNCSSGSVSPAQRLLNCPAN